MKKITAFLSLLFLATISLQSQTVLVTEGFETDGDGSRYESNEFDDGGNDFWTRTNVSPDPGSSSNQTYTDWIGAYHWNGEDIDATDNPLGSGQPGYITLQTLDVSSYQSGMIEFKAYFAADSNGSGLFETSDYFRIEYAFDSDISTGANSVGGLPAQADLGSGTYAQGGGFYGDGTNSVRMMIDSDNDGDADVNDSGTPLGNKFREYSFSWSVPGSASNMSVRVVGFTGSGEIVAIDSITVIGTGGATPLSASITNNTPTSCFAFNDGSLTVTASNGTSPYTYLWSNFAGSATATNLIAGTYTVTVTDNVGSTATASAFVSQPTAVSATATATSTVSCNGLSDGVATAVASGGTGAYTYLWSNAATSASNTGLVTGTYSLTVTDNNGCTATDAVFISEPNAVSATATATQNVSTNGGSDGIATGSVSGGTAPYTYSWSNGSTSVTNSGLVAGTYTITITDANGCTDVDNTTITQPTALTATIAVDSTVTCFGFSDGGATASGTGGSTPYTFLWSNSATSASITGVTSGVYTVTLTDNAGATATDNVAISQPSALNGTITSTTDVSCNGGSDGSATASASNGTGPYTYLWSNAATSASNTGLTAGTYTLTVTDANGCTDVESTSISEPAAIVAAATATQNVSTTGGSDGIATASATGGTSPYTYTWNNAATTATNSALMAGTYSVTVTDANGCTDSASATITQPTVAVVYGLPYSENFDAIAFDNVSFGPGSEPFPVSTNGLFVNDWQNVQADAASQDWYGRSTSTGSSNTGPTSDHTGGGRYIFVEDGFGNHTDITLESPFIDLVGVTSAQFTYWAHSRTTSSSHNKMWVDINDNGVWVNIDSIGQLSTTDTWFERNIDISAWVGDTVQFRFRVDNSTTSFQHDIAIDDVTIIETVFGASLDSTVTSITCFGDAAGFLRASAVFGTTPYTYNWSNGDTSAAANNLVAGTYTVTVSDNAGATVTLTDTIVHANSDVSSTFTASQPSCFGGSDGSISLDTIFGGAQTPSAGSCQASSAFSCVGASSTDTLGTGTSTNGTTSYPAIYGNWYWGARHQILYRASELLAMGITPGSMLNSVSWDVAQVNGTSNYTGFRIAIACTNDSDLTNGYVSGASEVLAPTNHTVTVGWNQHVFDTPYLWDGVSNLVVQICFNNSGFTNNSATRYTTTPFTSVRYYRADISTVCSNTTSSTGTSANRPNIIFESCVAGIDPYSYNWSNGGTTGSISGLTAGTYTVTITDLEGCTFTDSVNVMEPAQLVATMSSTDVSCNGFSDGTATSMATGGTSPYTYLWSNAGTTSMISSLGAGTFTVTVTDNNGCTAINSVSISEPTILNATNTTSTNVSCNGGNDGSATASAGGGTTPYSYLWSNGATTATNSNLLAGTYTVTITDANGCTDTDNATITEPTALASSTVVDSNVTCNGFSDGGATASASGGTMPYTYSWSNSASTASVTGVAAGTYTVTVTDANGCAYTDNITITEPTILATSTVVDSNVTCNGFSDGGATASASGGTMPYTYNWSNSSTTASITGVIAASYTVTVTDNNGCTATSTVTITEPTAVSAIISASTNVSCNAGNDGSATATASGGTGAYTYSWSNGSNTSLNSGLSAGTYTVTVTDNNGCTDTDNVTITEPTAVNATISASTNVSCNGGTDGSATATASGGTGAFTYLWSNASTTASISGLSAGTYTVTVTDNNGCTDTDNVSITEPALLMVATVIDSNVSCNGFADGGATSSASGGTSPYTYNWSNAASTASITGVIAGTYTVTITDNNGCTTTDNITITEPTVLVTTSVVDSNVTCNGGNNGGISATSTGGTMPFTYLWTTGVTTTRITNASAGTYTVTVTDANGCTDTTSNIITEPTALVVSSVFTDVSCNGGNDGTATAIASGGTAPYTYNWSTASSTATTANLSVGTYFATVTDANGCSDTTSATIGQPTAIAATVMIDGGILCNGDSTGAASVSSISGGTTPYAINWSTGSSDTSIVGLGAGTYTVSVTDGNACVYLDSVTITEPTAISITLNVDTSITCFGGSNGAITSTVSGGIAPYQYQWSNGDSATSISGLNIGTYSLTIIDSNGCVSMDSLILTEPAEIITNVSDTTCDTYTWAENGMTYTVSGIYDDVKTAANGCDSTIRLDLTIINSTTSTFVDSACFTYTWAQNGMTYTQTGIYADTLAGANAVGCDSVIMLDLTIKRADVTLIRNGLDLIALANGGNATFQWLDCGNGDTVITGADSNVFTIPKNGFYSVVVSQNGCTDTSICFNVVNIGIDEINIEQALKVYPNPTRDRVIFELEGINNNFEILQIYDMSGNLIREVQIQSNREEIDVSDFADGIYLLRYGSVYRKLIVTE